MPGDDKQTGNAVALWFGERFAALSIFFVGLGTAVCYFAGSMYRRHLTEQYGLAEPPGNVSIHEMISLGASIWLIRVVLFFAGTIALVVIIMHFGRKIAPHNAQNKRGWKDDIPIFAVVAVCVLGLVALIGQGAGNERVKEIQSSLYGDCDLCWTYVTTDRTVRGVPIISDDSRMYIAIRGGVMAIEKTSIRTMFGHPHIEMPVGSPERWKKYRPPTKR